YNLVSLLHDSLSQMVRAIDLYLCSIRQHPSHKFVGYAAMEPECQGAIGLRLGLLAWMPTHVAHPPSCTRCEVQNNILRRSGFPVQNAPVWHQVQPGIKVHWYRIGLICEHTLLNTVH